MTSPAVPTHMKAWLTTPDGQQTFEGIGNTEAEALAAAQERAFARYTGAALLASFSIKYAPHKGRTRAITLAKA